jgi:hypothetical protein
VSTGRSETVIYVLASRVRMALERATAGIARRADGDAFGFFFG